MPVLGQSPGPVRGGLAEDEPWELGEFEGSDARVVLDLISWMDMQWEAEWTGLSKTEAKWLVRIRKLDPDDGLGPFRSYVLARLYAIREGSGQRSNPDLDSYLAHRPWEYGERKTRYLRLVERGLIPRPPVWNYLVEATGTWRQRPWETVSDDISAQEATSDEERA